MKVAFSLLDARTRDDMLASARASRRAIGALARDALDRVACVAQQLPRSRALASEPSGDAERLSCATRERSGTTSSKQARRDGRVPAVLFAPGSEDKVLLSVCEREMNAAVRKHTLDGLQCEVFELEVREGEGEPRIVRALAKQVTMHAYNQTVNNVSFLEVQPETQVRVRVPVRTQGEDVSPGVKRGGFVQILRRTVPVRCRSDSIPKKFVMDVSGLDSGKIIKISDVQPQVPEGCKLLDRNLSLPLIMIGGKVKSATA